MEAPTTSDFEVSAILESMRAQKGSSIFHRKREHVILNEEVLTAAEILYELDNGEGEKIAKNLGKRKVVEDGISNRNKKLKHLVAGCDTNNSAQSLCNKFIEEDSGDQNYSHIGKGKLKIGAPSENDFQKRFEDRKRSKQVTIGQSSDETRAYFRGEETLRYLCIDKSYKYTALDGSKSSVAPLRKKCEKTIRKSHHHIFKDDIPPKFSLLRLVRDASARLPGGVGTRDDICKLVRDSQYVIDNISEKELKQIVSGTLDRLHREVDPCVKFNRERGMWMYLHGDREEGDFREDGTYSLKGKKGKERMDSN